MTDRQSTRRDFLATTAGLAAASAFAIPNLVGASPMVPTNPVALNDILSPEQIEVILAEHNRDITQRLNLLCSNTTERIHCNANCDNTTVRVQCTANCDFLGTPIRRSDIAFPDVITYQDLSVLLSQDRFNVEWLIQAAIFWNVGSIHYDRFRDNFPIPIKPFLNGDGWPIPNGVLGQTFDLATHSHYMASTGDELTGDDVDRLLTNVIEHKERGEFFLFVSRLIARIMCDRPTDFPMFRRCSYQQSGNDIYPDKATGTAPIGTYRDATVLVQPWMPANALFCFSGTSKPLARRYPVGGTPDFHIIPADPNKPESLPVGRRENGFAVRDRTAGAVMTMGTGGSYRNPLKERS